MASRRAYTRVAGGIAATLAVALIAAVAASARPVSTPAVSGSAVSASVAGESAPVRYLDRVFDEVDVTRDLVYRPAGPAGIAEERALDVYEPHGDPATARPLVVWLHGGGFTDDTKEGEVDVVVSTRFAQHGAVVASIDYTWTGADGTEGADDAQVAVAWLRANAGRFRIDPTRVVLAGASAGAITALTAGYLPDVTGGEPEPDRRVDALVSYEGRGPLDAIQAGEPPLFMAHGTRDTVVPHSDAVATCDAARAVGIECRLESYDADHTSFIAYAEQIEAVTWAWLYDTLELADADNPPLATTTTTTTTPPTAPPATAPSADPVPAPADFAG